MQRLGTILHKQARPIQDTDRFRLTPSGEAALDAASLRAELPTLYGTVEAAARGGQSPEEIARHATASGASDNLARQITNAARHLQERH